MITAEQIEQWRGRSVVDADGQDLGKLDDVYYAAAGEPVLVRIRSGLMGRHQALVPLSGSSVTRDYLRVGYQQAQIQAAGDVEIAERLDPATAASIGSAYGIALPGADEGFETSAQLQARRAAAIAAQQQADALLDDAHRLGGQAAHERAKAADADASATQAEHDAAAAAARAEAARHEAEAAAQGADPPLT
jgi:PRC-barrel domain